MYSIDSIAEHSDRRYNQETMSSHAEYEDTLSHPERRGGISWKLIRTIHCQSLHSSNFNLHQDVDIISGMYDMKLLCYVIIPLQILSGSSLALS